MVEFQIIDIVTGFKVRQIVDGVPAYESNAYPKGGAKVEVANEHAQLLIHKYQNTYAIPIHLLTVPANDGSAQDVYTKITQIIF